MATTTKVAPDRLAVRGEKLRHRADRGFVDPAEIANRPENLPADSLDRDPVESMIRRLPENLQATVRLLSYGCSRKLIAERHGVSPSTVTNRIAWFHCAHDQHLRRAPCRRLPFASAPRGKPSSETTGFKGKACQDATRQLEAALGKVEAEHKKPEFFQAAGTSQQQTAG